MAEEHQILALFRTTLRRDRKYLHKQQDFVNRKMALQTTDTGKLNLVYFGPQTAKNRTGVLTYQMGGHLTGQ